jgi:two-component system OmpR family sensor kinase
MKSFRATLTLWYTVALAAAVVAFGVVLTVLQRNALDETLEERLREITGRVESVLETHARDGRGPLVDITFSPRMPDAPLVSLLRADVQDRLSVISGVVLVLDSAGIGVFFSPEVRRLSPQAQNALRGAVAAVSQVEQQLSLSLDGTDYRVLARRVQSAGRSIMAIAVGEPAPDTALALQRFAASLILVIPVILVFAALVGYVLASRALVPVGHMIDEVEAITDGRSLHRRLLAPAVQVDEIDRLANALNGLMARLEASFSALRRFVADASHELKTPLTIMRAGVERALTEQKLPTEAMQPLEETLQSVRHMTELVESLLTLARVDEGRMELHTEPVDLGAVLSEVHETAQILGEEAGLEVVLETPAEPVFVDGDHGRLRQLVMNLATNAVKYTPRGGRVALTLSQTNAAISISVRDTGIGIAPGDVGRVFDRFWRADIARSRTGEQTGFGLGLSIARWIAEAHGGSIAVTSRPGRGSVFTVTLPKASPPPVIVS